MAQVVDDNSGNRWLQMPDGSYQAMMGGQLVEARGLDMPGGGYGGRRYGPTPYGQFPEIPGFPGVPGMPGMFFGIPTSYWLAGLALWWFTRR